MNVYLSNNANDALGISKEVKFAIVHTISAESANIAASETISTILNLSSVRPFVASLSDLL